MATDYPVTFDVVRPERFERTQVFLRILIVIIISIVTSAVGWIFGLVYLLLPVLAAILVSNRGRERFIEEDGGAEPDAIGRSGSSGECGESIEGGEVEEDVLGGPDGVVAQLLDAGGVTPLVGVEVDAELKAVGRGAHGISHRLTQERRR